MPQTTHQSLALHLALGTAIAIALGITLALILGDIIFALMIAPPAGAALGLMVHTLRHPRPAP
jgi:hypothetical protein